MTNKNTISFEVLQSVDIRIGRVLTVEEIEGADKLYKMLVDFGEEKTRIVVSAIKEHFFSIELEGKKFPFVMNLEPRKIRGIISEAMIVLAENQGRLSSIEDARIGSIVF